LHNILFKLFYWPAASDNKFLYHYKYDMLLTKEFPESLKTPRDIISSPDISTTFSSLSSIAARASIPVGDPTPPKKVSHSPSVHLPTPHVTTTPKLPKIVKKSAKNTKIAQKMTKSARFLQKNTKKYQFFTIFLPQNGPKPTNSRHMKY